MKNKNWKWILGLTGGLGSGKSTVLKTFKEEKAFVLDADRIVFEALKDKTNLKKIERMFGSSIFNRKRVLDRRKLADLIFKSKPMRRRLEGLLHPIVRRTMQIELAQHRGEVAVCDVPLLYERGWERDFDKVIVVEAPLKTRFNRLKKNGFASEDIRARIKAQWPLSKKIKKADFVIHNGGSIQQTKTQVQQIWTTLMRGTHGIAARTKKSSR